MTLLTQSEFDKLYARALNSLKVRSKKTATRFGEPYWTKDGIRLIEIDGVPWTDEQVFKEAWGEESAHRVMAKRQAASGKSSSR